MKLKPVLLDRYIFRSFFVAFAGSCAMFVFVVLLFNIMNQLSYFSKQNIPLSTIFEMYFYKSFLQFTIVSPAAALFAAIFTINNLAKNNELIAIINSGMSVYRLCLSIILFGFIFSLGMVPFNDHVVFPATRKAEAMSDRIRRRRVRKNYTRDVKLWGRNALFYKAQNYNKTRKTLHNLVVVKLRDRFLSSVPAARTVKNKQVRTTLVVVKKKGLPRKKRVPMPLFSPDRIEKDFLYDVRGFKIKNVWLFRIEAKRAVYDKKRKGWVLFDGSLRKYGKRRVRGVYSFKRRFFPLPETDYDFSQDHDKVNAMTTAEARRHIERLKKSGRQYGKEEVEYYLKFSFPLVNFIIIIIGISFGGFTSRSVMLVSFFIAIVIYMLYYFFVAIGLSLGKIGVLAPAIGAWLGNIAFFAIGVTLLAFRKT